LIDRFRHSPMTERKTSGDLCERRKIDRSCWHSLADERRAFSAVAAFGHFTLQYWKMEAAAEVVRVDIV
jgi:hypothetical protein